MTSPGAPRASGSASGLHPSSSAARDGGRFAPGALLGERYRIVGMLGKGGMGEVYRADDLKLGQGVALKLLPESVQADPERLERLIGEVRVALQVSHPAVCRVHDIGEVDGLHYISMEYVDGEDLASLLRRIGRLPQDKAIDIARQLCAGIAAAHDKGVLHRDLKPENVMLDGRGKVRITDFGLAGIADAIADVRSGTPAYMSPEQLTGREVTARSDIYSLGLVLYELFTGKRAFEGKSFAELLRKHEGEAPLPPSALVEGLDGAVERVILRCLEKSPQRRPATALAVAAALPGGDPLAAALAAGETPSPELVAAAGRAAGIGPGHAWAALALIAIAMVAAVLLMRRQHVLGIGPNPRAPAALEDRARDLVRRLGYAEPPADTAVGYAHDIDYQRHVIRSAASQRRWSAVESGVLSPLHFYYRQSPRPLVSNASDGRVYWANPPLVVSGMVNVRLDAQGRLLRFVAVPRQAQTQPQVETRPQVHTPPQTEDRAAGGPSAAPEEAAGDGGDAGPAREESTGTPVWRALFAEARLPLEQFQPTRSLWTPPFFCDTRAAWQGSVPGLSEIPLRVEACAHEGRVTYFEVVAPWARPERMQAFERTRGSEVALLFMVVLVACLLAASGILARRHVRLGRGDRRGAFRVAAATFALNLLAWLVGADHVADAGSELGLAFEGVGYSLVLPFVVWVFYLALEPYARRIWPHMLIGWSRLLGGGPRDPFVARDVLVGLALGAVLAVLILLSRSLQGAFGSPPAPPFVGVGLDVLIGLRHGVALALRLATGATFFSMGSLLVLVVLRLLLRSPALAALGFALVQVVPRVLADDSPGLYSAVANAIIIAVITAVFLRFGLLAIIVGVYCADLLLAFPVVGELSGWLAPGTTFPALVIAAVAAYAVATGLGGRSLLGGLVPAKNP